MKYSKHKQSKSIVRYNGTKKLLVFVQTIHLVIETVESHAAAYLKNIEWNHYDTNSIKLFA